MSNSYNVCSHAHLIHGLATLVRDVLLAPLPFLGQPNFLVLPLYLPYLISLHARLGYKDNESRDPRVE
ncbi:hypothetical protein D3C71_1929540 [compost metagenome]